MIKIKSNQSVHLVVRLRRLDKHWWLLVAAFIMGGIFEVFDNILGLRRFNFESSAPVFIKVMKELVIFLLLGALVLRNGFPRVTIFGLSVLTMVALCSLSLLISPPLTYYARFGLLYYLISLGMLLAACALSSPDNREEFSRHFVLMVILAIFLSQVLEIMLAPISMYHETSLLGFDRRSGVAVIPTTAGLLGVVGFATLRGVPRLLSLVVIGLANSSVSFVCLAIVFVSRMRNPVYVLISVPFVVVVVGLVLMSREGLETSINMRLDILADSIHQLKLIGPSQIGALSTAKSVALQPDNSYIVDSMYLETLHIFGIVPGVLLIGAILLTLLRRVGCVAMLIFAIAGIGYLIMEAWIVWLSIIFAFHRSGCTGLRIRP